MGDEFTAPGVDSTRQTVQQAAKDTLTDLSASKRGTSQSLANSTVNETAAVDDQEQDGLSAAPEERELQYEEPSTVHLISDLVMEILESLNIPSED